MRDEGVSRHITGRLTDRGGGVGLDLRKNHLFGYVGPRSFQLARKDDQYVGSVRISESLIAAATINGAEELWSFRRRRRRRSCRRCSPATATSSRARCAAASIVGFGGRQTWEGKRVSSVYHNVSTDQARAMMNDSHSGMRTSGAVQ